MAELVIPFPLQDGGTGTSAFLTLQNHIKISLHWNFFSVLNTDNLIIFFIYIMNIDTSVGWTFHRLKSSYDFISAVVWFILPIESKHCNTNGSGGNPMKKKLK